MMMTGDKGDNREEEIVDSVEKGLDTARLGQQEVSRAERPHRRTVLLHNSQANQPETRGRSLLLHRQPNATVVVHDGIGLSGYF